MIFESNVAKFPEVSFLLFTHFNHFRRVRKETVQNRKHTHTPQLTYPSTSVIVVMAIANCEFSIRITMLEMNDDDYGVREINTFDVHHANINYRGEGNANVVLALPLRCQVVRLPKSKRLCIILVYIHLQYSFPFACRISVYTWPCRNNMPNFGAMFGEQLYLECVCAQNVAPLWR